MPTAQTFYVVPKDTDPFVVESLRTQHQADPSIVVVVDKRQDEDRPSAAVLAQRRPVLRRTVPDGPVQGARLEQHIPPIALTLAEEPFEQIVARASAHDPAAAGELRWRCYEFVIMQLTQSYGNRAKADAQFPRVMDAILDELPGLPRPADFFDWLLTLVPRLAGAD